MSDTSTESIKDGAPAETTPKPAPPVTSQQAPTTGEPPAEIRLPDDHPLVKTLAAQKAEIKALKEQQRGGADDLSERVAEAERRAAEAEARALRREVALEHKLSKDDAALLDNLTDEATMQALAARLAASGNRNNHVPTEGNNPSPKEDGRRAFADFLTGRTP